MPRYRPRISRVAFPLAVAFLAFGPSRGSAQERWSVLTAVSDGADAPRARTIARHLAAALEARGEALVGDEHAAALADAELGRPFAPAPADLARRLTETAAAVLDDVAFGRNQRALDRGEPLLGEIEAHAAALNRGDGPLETGNLCLFLVRADLQLHRADRARERALTCLRIVPDLVVDPALHPPAVRDAVTRTREAVTRAGSTLSIQAGHSDPEGCAIRVSGRTIGRTRGATLPVPAGRYAVQVECAPEVPGRLLMVDVAAGAPATLAAPAELLGVIRTGGAVTLEYATPEQLEASLARHVAFVSRVLHAPRSLVAVVSGERVTVRAFETADGSLARLRGTAPLDDAVDVAASERALDIARGELSALSTAGPLQEPPSPGRADVGIAIAGGATLALGLFGYGVSWFLWSEADSQGGTITRAATGDQLASAQRSFDDRLPPLALAGVVSSVLATAAIPLLLPDEPAVPWWSWIAGAAALVAAGVGVYFLATDGSCYANDVLLASCPRRAPLAYAGTLLLGHAAPLIAMPITHLVRAAIASSSGQSTVSASVTLGPHETTLSIWGTL